MTTLTAAQRRTLRAQAHPLHPVVAIGHHGLTPSVMHEIDVALAAHELVKVRVFDDDRGAREGLMTRICAELACAPVQHIGKLLVLWRENPAKHEKPAVTRRPRAAKGAPEGRRAAASSAARGEASPRRRRAMAAAPAPRAPAAPDARRRRGRAEGDTAVPAGPHAPSRRRRRSGG
jgi:putative YhbY family RNA-binding protein